MQHLIETRNKLEDLRKKIGAGKISYKDGSAQLTENDKVYTRRLGIFMLVAGIAIFLLEQDLFYEGMNTLRILAHAPMVLLAVGYALFKTRNYLLMAKKGAYLCMFFYSGLTGLVLCLIKILMTGYYYPSVFQTSIIFALGGFILSLIRRTSLNVLYSERV